MATGNINKRNVEGVEPGASDAFLWDEKLPGFGLKVTPAGRRLYLFQYRVRGKAAPVRMTLGEHGGFDEHGRPWTPDRARTESERLRGLVSAGRDPVKERRTQREAEAQAERDRAAAAARLQAVTVSALAAEFLKRVEVERPASKRFYEPNLRLHILPLVGAMPMPELTQADALRVIEAVPATQRALRRSVFATARALWNWSARRIELPDRSPFERIGAPLPAKSRDRVLTDTELALAIRAARAMPLPFGPFYELAFATGQRREEIAGLDWSELDQDAGLWTLPGHRTKNGEANIVPLNRHAVAALDRAAAAERAKQAMRALEAERAAEGRKLTAQQRREVFTAVEARVLAKLAPGDGDWPKDGLVLSGTGDSPVSGYSRAKARLDDDMLAIARADAIEAGDRPNKVRLAPWRLHDARRTLATGLQRLGVRFEVTEAILNHTSGASRSGVAAVYQRHGWGPEKRAALDAWAEHCDRAIAPGADGQNVVQLRRGA